MSLEEVAQIIGSELWVGVLDGGELVSRYRIDLAAGRWSDESPRFWPNVSPAKGLHDLQSIGGAVVPEVGK